MLTIGTMSYEQGNYLALMQDPKLCLLKNACFSDDVAQGMVFGIITATGRAGRYTKQRTTATKTTGDTVIPVVDGGAYQAGDVISVGTETGFTVLSVTGNNVTINTGLAGTQNSGVLVTTTDGRELAIGIMGETSQAKTYNREVSATVIMSGPLYYSKLRFLNADALTDLGGKVVTAYDLYKF